MALKYWAGTEWIEITGRGLPEGAGGGTTTWGEVTNKPATFPPSTHTHAIADVNGLQAALNAKGTSNLVIGTSAGTAMAGNTSLFDGVYGSLSGIPSTFTPAAHTHTIANVTGLQAALNAKGTSDLTLGTTAGTALAGNTALFNGQYGSLSGVPSTFTPAAHTHTIANVTGLQTALDNASSGGFSGAYSALTGIPTTFAPAAHTHSIANIDGLQTALNAKGTSNLALGTTSVTAMRGNTTAANLGAVVAPSTGLTIWRGTEAQYAAIGTKDSNTLYLREP